MEQSNAPEQPKQVIQRVDTQLDKMTGSPHIWGDSDFNDLVDVDVDESKIYWMGTNANLVDTPQEELEKKLAIQHQIKTGILDAAGIPVGFTYDELGVPKEMQDQLKAMKVQSPLPPAINPPKRTYSSKWERKADRERLRNEDKLARANKLILSHQQEPAKRK
jgi:hypothetical protein